MVWFGLAWYAKDAIANILSFANVFDTYDIDLVKKEHRTFLIWAPKNDIVFKQHSLSLYYHKVGDKKFVLPYRNERKNKKLGHCHANTVAQRAKDLSDYTLTRNRRI